MKMLGRGLRKFNGGTRKLAQVICFRFRVFVIGESM